MLLAVFRDFNEVAYLYRVGAVFALEIARIAGLRLQRKKPVRRTLERWDSVATVGQVLVIAAVVDQVEN